MAAVSVTNEADINELQTLMNQLQEVFGLDPRLQDGVIRIQRQPDTEPEADTRDAAGPVQLSEEYQDKSTKEILRKVRSARDPEETSQEATREETESDATPVAETAGEKADSDEKQGPSCTHCGQKCDPRGLHRHEKHCGENPENAEPEEDEDDAETAESDDADNKDSGESEANSRVFTCGTCGGEFDAPVTASPKYHDCSGEAAEPDESDAPKAEDTESEAADSEEVKEIGPARLGKLMAAGTLDEYECNCGKTFESETDAQSHADDENHPEFHGGDWIGAC